MDFDLNYNSARVALIAFAFFIVFVLAYRGVFVLNEEVLVAICFVLFISLSVILLSDVVKESIFSRLVTIKNKFYDLQLNIKKQTIEDYYSQLNNNIFSEIPFILDFNPEELNYNSYELVMTELLSLMSLEEENDLELDQELEFVLTTTILDNLPEENLIITRDFTELLNLVSIYFYFDYLLTSQDSDIIENNNNQIYNLTLEYVKYNEYNDANIVFNSLARETFLAYGENLGVNKEQLEEIMG
uniref:ATP synthase F0 subunit b n=1 Tax=Malawimonas californiana TaxID=221722 RepID=A0A0B5GFS6_MALCL|nr:ATP synthase F0 subunit b [Malawimonas californiana]AJF22862.1 ATP synthase F0 subunit b [Malawimonas californiana]